MAGHSAWKNIKHRKAAVDAKRGKMWSKCARLIIVAARVGGGDPTTNLSLRYAIDDARAVNMPRDTIEKAIKKGTGELQAESYESIVYEGYGPGGVAILMEILTDNRNRTSGDIRRILDKAGGNLGTTGCVSYFFQQRGQFMIDKAHASEEKIMTLALDAGALDVADAGDHWQVLTEAHDFIKVRQALEAAKMPMESAVLTMIPTSTVTVTGEGARELLELIETLEDYEDVQKVHANFEIPDSEMKLLG